MTDSPLLIEDLRAHPLFSGLTDEQYGWLSAAGTARELADGETLFTEGSPARFFVVLLEGELLITKVVDGREEVLTRHSTRPDAERYDDGTVALAHTFTAELPVLADDAYLVTAMSVGATRVGLYERDAFLEMLARVPEVSRTLLPVLAMRVRDMTVGAGQRSALAALGTLAAGLAHELNNPVAAVTRAIGGLGDALDGLQARAEAWGAAADEEERAALRAAAREWESRRRGASGWDILEAGEFEEELQDWLEDHGLPDGAVLAELLVERGLDASWLGSFAGRVRPEVLPEALGYLSSMLQTRSYVVDVREAGTRISGIVRDTKEYTNLDRAPEREVDVRLGIETTLAMLRPQLAGITVVQRHAPDVPAIQGYPGELNQVWTNLIDNAADALDGRGELVITVRREGACVLVEVADDGPGVPAEILPRLFEPFFTTKDIGVGTGLGLHLTHRIVTQRHRGSIVVRSRPGDTRFQVRLPIDGGAGCESPVSGG